MISGLSSIEAKNRLTRFGFNELPSSKPKTIVRIALEVVKEPMFLLLISCAVLYMLLGDYREGIILLSTIFIIIGITFYQHRKTERALETLKNLASPRALVIRDGLETRIPGREVVPGDLIVLHEGDRIAADVLIVQCTNLMVDESLLTGESMPVLKTDTDGEGKGHAYAGSLVVRGKGLGQVLSTGVKSRFGEIGVSLSEINSDQETRLQKELKTLIRKLFAIGAALSVLVVILFYLARGNFIESLLSGLAASMAILPEEFPVVLTVFMALGAWRLSRRNVLTRKSSAIETLGSATVLCTDKTGTITQNKMEVKVVYDGTTLHQLHPSTFSDLRISTLLTSAKDATEPDTIDPMETAIHAAARQASSNTKDHRVIREYPLTTALMAMTRVHGEIDDVSFNVNAKGAPEAIFKLCRMSETDIARHTDAVTKMAGQGYRVLGVAAARYPEENLPDSQEAFLFEFLGLLGLEDPIRPEVPTAMKECQKAGIRVVMITGDFPATAKSIAQQAGLTAGRIVTGDELNSLSENELQKIISSVNVFARVIPEQKLRIVQALSANNEIVAMTGDGVNDAPALKAAHIGIAMGKKGTDVAREASSLVLLDDNFASIVAAIRLGRRIFDNLQKAMSYIMAIHIPIIGLTLLPAFFSSLPILLMPIHIVFMELIIDPVCSIAFEWEREEKGIMDRPPRPTDKKFFGLEKIGFSILQGLLLLTTTTAVYFLSYQEGHSDGEIRAIAFSSLIVGNLFLILTDLSNTRSFLSVLKEGNIPLLLILGGAFATLLLTITIPALGEIFSFDNPGYNHFLPALVGATSMLVVLEFTKYGRNRRNHVDHSVS